MAREATEAAMAASYKHGVVDTETRLAKEVSGMARDYYAKT